MRDFVSMLPFTDELVVLDLSGRDVLVALETGVSSWPRKEGRFLQVGSSLPQIVRRRGWGLFGAQLHLSVGCCSRLPQGWCGIHTCMLLWVARLRRMREWAQLSDLLRSCPAHRLGLPFSLLA